MKKIDSEGLDLCIYQAQLFAESRNRFDCSSAAFIRRFMLSELAKRMDGIGFLCTSTYIDAALDELEDEYGKSDYGSEKYSEEELYWIGYLYRYWAYTREMESWQIYKKRIKPGELRELFFPYHSLDPEQAIERIVEAKGIKEVLTFQDQVDIMRRITEEMRKNGQLPPR